MTTALGSDAEDSAPVTGVCCVYLDPLVTSRCQSRRSDNTGDEICLERAFSFFFFSFFQFPSSSFELVGKTGSGRLICIPRRADSSGGRPLLSCEGQTSAANQKKWFSHQRQSPGGGLGLWFTSPRGSEWFLPSCQSQRGRPPREAVCPWNASRTGLAYWCVCVRVCACVCVCACAPGSLWFVVVAAGSVFTVASQAVFLRPTEEGRGGMLFHPISPFFFFFSFQPLSSWSRLFFPSLFFIPLPHSQILFLFLPCPITFSVLLSIEASSLTSGS